MQNFTTVSKVRIGLFLVLFAWAFVVGPLGINGTLVPTLTTTAPVSITTTGMEYATYHGDIHLSMVDQFFFVLNNFDRGNLLALVGTWFCIYSVVELAVISADKRIEAKRRIVASLVLPIVAMLVLIAYYGFIFAILVYTIYVMICKPFLIPWVGKFVPTEEYREEVALEDSVA